MPPKNQPPPPRSQATVPPPSSAPAVDTSALQKRIGELETQVADLTPRANAHKSQKDDLGRQQFQAHKLQDEARAAAERAHQEKLHFEAQRLQLTGDAEAFVAAERAKRLAALEAELGTERARVEKVAAGVRDAAEAAAASLRADAETRLRSATAESGRLRKEADDALANANAEAQKLLATARSEAAAEGVRLREEASRSTQHTKESAQVAAGERVESARIEAARAIEVARAEAARLLEAARKDSAQLRATAQKELSEAEQARLVAERRAAERVQVEEESARKAAAAKVAPILKDAQDRADGINKHAEERERAVAEAARKLEEQTRALDVRDADVKATARKTAHRDTLNEQLSIELEAQERNLRERQEAFAKAEARVGTAAVARLTEERDEARAMLNASRERNQAIVLERDQIARTLEEAGGIDLAARVLEIEKLRARVGELLAERATMAHEEELAALRAENERLRGVATRVADAEKRARELERAQAGADHAIAVARDQAAREVATANSAVVHHLSEVTRLAAENSALKGEGEALVTRIAGTQRLADEQKSLLIDRDWLEARVRELERTLEDRNKLANQRSKDRYGKLAELDAKPIVSGFAPPEAPMSLRSLTEHARDRMAGDGRYYDAHTVQSWMASLAAHRMVVLQGLSGTGKTSLPVHFAKAIGGWCVPVPVQSGWRDKADLFGFYNTFDHRFRASEFTKAVYTANLPDFADRPVFLVLDECNLSRVEYYFADLLSELQLDAREQGEKKLGPAFTERFPDSPPHLLHVSDQPDEEAAPKHLIGGQYLSLPQNIWIIGTANEDESTFELADKTLDRAGILQMDGRATSWKPKDRVIPPVSWSGLDQAFTAAQDAWKEGARLHKWVEDFAPALEKRFEIAFGNRFEVQAAAFMPVYEHAGFVPGVTVDLSRSIAADHLLQTRILRKLRRIRDPGREPDVRALRDDLVKTWPWRGGPPTRSLELIDRVSARLSGRR